MGAVCDLRTILEDITGYVLARHIREFFGSELTEDQVKGYVLDGCDGCGSETVKWYRRLCGEDYSAFLLYEWTFTEHPKSLAELKKIATEDPDLDYIERLSTNDDFLTFHPKEHSMGIELIIHNGLSPDEVTERLRSVLVDDACGGCRRFCMEW